MTGTHWTPKACPECGGDQDRDFTSPNPCPGCGGLGFIWVMVRRPRRHGIVRTNGTTS